MRRLSTVVCVAALLASGMSGAQEATPPLPGEATAPQPRLALTIYNQNLALVEDLRSLNLPQGRTRQEFPSVSAQIRPETVSISAPNTEVVEQNFDYDLLSPDSLMSAAVGQEVRIVRTNPGNGQETSERATILAVNNGVVLRVGDRIEILRQDSVPTRVIFDRVPPNMRARPTLSVTLDSSQAGPRDVRLSYLSRGLQWRADYVALFDETTSRLNLQGWITLTNESGTTYENAETRLVAGDVNGGGRGGSTRSAGTESGDDGEALADFYIYPLPERVTVAQNQTKQVNFLDVQNAQARRTYLWRAYGFQSMEQPAQVASVLEFSNARAAGLGAQLPAGVLRVYQRDRNGTPQFVGENRIDHTPQGSDVAVQTGRAFDVTVQSTLVNETRVNDATRRYEMRYVVRNARSQPRTVSIRQYGLWDQHRMVRESLPSTRENSSTRAWDVTVPGNGETVLTFTVETRI